VYKAAEEKSNCCHVE